MRARWVPGRGLAGLRKDGSIFPVRISLSSVPTATGRFTLALIRDYSVAQPPADLGGLARAAAAARHSRQGQELLDRAVNRLFQVGFSLQAALKFPQPCPSGRGNPGGGDAQHRRRGTHGARPRSVIAL